MAERFVDRPGTYLLPRRTHARPESVSGARQLLLGARLEADLATEQDGLVAATDIEGHAGFVELARLREDPLLKVFFVDVGQGDATVVQHQDGILVIDGGPNRGFRDWLLQHFAPVIAREGRLRISTLVVSHFDLDHYQGLTTLLRHPRVHVDRILHNGLPRYRHDARRFLNLGHAAPDGRITTDLDDLASAAALRGQGVLAPKFASFVEAAETAHAQGRLGILRRVYRRRLDRPAPTLPGFGRAGRSVEVLGPVPTDDAGRVRLPVFADPHDASGNASESHTVNGNSVVLRLRYGAFTFLFGGDLNQPAQRYLLDRYRPIGQPDVFSVDVNKACHHGSADFEVEYLTAVRPQATVFSSGDSGTHDHPMPDAIGAAARHTDVDFPLVFSTELARETGPTKTLLGHINARSNGAELVMAQRKEKATTKKTWHTFAVPYPGPFA